MVGRSGSGKSRLLHLVAGLDRRFRGETLGVVFQSFQLLPTLTAAENVLLAMDLVGRVPVAKRRARTLELLEQVGVIDQADKLPTALSGGQQQRVAIARALANDPPLPRGQSPPTA